VFVQNHLTIKAKTASLLANINFTLILEVGEHLKNKCSEVPQIMNRSLDHRIAHYFFFTQSIRTH
jgi:hypothetical protein